MESVDNIRAEIAELEQALKDKRAQLRELRGSTAKSKESRECACGCGDLTKGTWVPGHDAKYRSAMLTLIDQGDESAIDALLARPTLLHGASEADLRERLGSETRKKEAQVEREAEAQAKRDAAKSAKVRPAPKPSAKTRVDVVEQQQGTKSPTVTRNGAATRLAKQRAAA